VGGNQGKDRGKEKRNRERTGAVGGGREKRGVKRTEGVEDYVKERRLITVMEAEESRGDRKRECRE
jgi:hypothetical protein